MVAVLLESRVPKIPIGLATTGYAVASAAIAWPALTYGPFTLFPGVSALPPVIGTALFIIIGAGQPNDRGLSRVRPLVYLGNISYGLYLWHWPLIVFSERLFPESSGAPVVAVILSVVLADRQLALIENPIRHVKRSRDRHAFGILSLTAVAVISVSGMVFIGSQSGLGLDNTSQFEQVSRSPGNCSFENGQLAPAEECTVEQSSSLRILLIGDSQAGSMIDGVIAVAQQLGASYRLAYGNSCPVHPRPNETRSSCDEIQSGFQQLVEEFQPSVVVVANASDLYVTRGGFGKPDTRIRQEDGSLPSNYQEALRNWVIGVREALVAPHLRGIPVVYVQMIPPAPVRSSTLLQPKASTASFSLTKLFDRNEVVKEERAALENLSNVEILDPADILCPLDQCRVSTSDGPIYRDAYHLNSRGVDLLVPEMMRLIKRSAN